MDLDNLKPTNRPSSIVNRQSQSAFTLIELMIVVSILGILAAVVYPEFQGHVQQAKEAQAKANLKLYRETIERYAFEHGFSPGYNLNNPANATSGGALKMQLVSSQKPYLRELPQNPFSKLRSILVLENTAEMPTEPTQTDIYGWIYKPATKNIKLNWLGSDNEGNNYFDY